MNPVQHANFRCRKILSFEDREPQGFHPTSHDFPPPFDDNALINDQGVNNSQPPKVIGSTNGLPFDHLVFTFVIRGIPI